MAIKLTLTNLVYSSACDLCKHQRNKLTSKNHLIWHQTHLNEDFRVQ